MRVTVCELPDEPEAFGRQWQRLGDHVHAEHSDLVVLPEMAFVPWFATTPRFNRDVWADAVACHDQWLERMDHLGEVIVCGSRPLDTPAGRRNVAFVREPHGEVRLVHEKAYLPDEQGAWEASWYDPGTLAFEPTTAGGASLGFLICSELWAFDWAIHYGRRGADLLITPRLTGKATRDKWLTAGRAAAIVAGAYSLSSNRVDTPDRSKNLGGQGWIVDPDGDVLALTSVERPFITTEIALEAAHAAKSTYPRYVLTPADGLDR